jgi:malonyl-CoA/methylmalonyl-CoA synthetase
MTETATSSYEVFKTGSGCDRLAMAMHSAPSFPNDPVLIALLSAARQYPGSEVVFHDVVGFEKTYPELLGDVLCTRDLIRARLPASALDENGLLSKETPYVALLTRTGYEFVVGFFAICAIGGAPMILGEYLPQTIHHK